MKQHRRTFIATAAAAAVAPALPTFSAAPAPMRLPVPDAAALWEWAMNEYLHALPDQIDQAGMWP